MRSRCTQLSHFGSAFIVDIKLGIVTWLIAAAHEIPQGLGNFGILVHSGWSALRALFHIALADLLPEIATTPVLRDKLRYTSISVIGVVVLWGVAHLAY